MLQAQPPHRFGTALLLAALAAGPFAPSGSALAEITSGGALNADPLTVTPPFSLRIGWDGVGWMRVAQGSTVSSQNGTLGFGFGGFAQGVVEVEGAGSSWTIVRDLEVGENAFGTLDILQGGLVTTRDAFIGMDAGGAGWVTVDGVGSQFIVAEDLNVGIQGYGSLSVMGGGWVESDRIEIGGDGSTGTVHVSGAGSQLMSHGSVLLGPYNSFQPLATGAGTLVVEDGGLVVIADSIRALAHTPGGAIQLNGGTINTTSGSVFGANLMGVGTINADYWLLEGSHVITDGALLPQQMVYDRLPGQNIQVNLAWSEAGGLLSHFGVDDGDVLLTGGAQLMSEYTDIGFSPDAVGLLTVSGAGTLWTQTRDNRVGHHGVGELRIEDGAAVDSTWNVDLGFRPGSSGTVTVAGPGSTWTVGREFMIGLQGSGDVVIENGGLLLTDTSFAQRIGQDTGASGRVTVTGAGSRWEYTGFSHGLILGFYGHGELVVADAGVAELSGITVGIDGTALAQVTGNGSLLDVDRDLSIGGQGTLRVVDGGTVAARNVRAGHSTAGIAQVLVDGTGSHLNVTEDYNSVWSAAESGGSSVLTVTTGGVVTVGGGLIINQFSDVSYIELNGGTINTFWGDVRGENLRGTGTINADHWVLSGTHVLSEVSDLPSQMLLQAFPDQDITMNLAWSDPQAMMLFGIDQGDLTIRDGLSLQQETGYIGYSAGSTGYVTVEGADTLWRTSRTLHVGFYGEGGFTVQDGAEVRAENILIGSAPGRNTGNGDVQATGVGTEIDADRVRVGHGQGAGSLSVTSGASASIGLLEIGDWNGAVGIASFHGAGTTLSGDGIQVESPVDGQSTLHISGGAVVGGTPFGEIGLSVRSLGDIASIARISGAGTEFYASGIGVASRGHGEVWIEDGALVLSPGGGGSIGGDPGSFGKIVVDGPGSTWSLNGSVSIGNEGTGELHITNGGFVSSPNHELVMASSGSQSKIVFGNGTLVVESGFAAAQQLLGTGNIQAEYWLLYGDHTVTSYAELPSQLRLTDLPGQDITIDLTWDSPQEQLLHFGVDDGNVALSNGVAMWSEQGFVGYGSDAVGNLTFSGVGTDWLLRNELFVGYEGNGTLRLENGAQATFIRREDSYVGYRPGSVGRLIVDGAGSLFRTDDNNSTDLYVGYEGHGTLEVVDGGFAGGTRLRLGEEAGSTGILEVSGVGSTLDFTTLQLGFRGSGTMLITDGAVVDDYASLGQHTGSYGEVRVSGAGSRWAPIAAIIGSSGEALLVVEDGGEATFTGLELALGNASRITVTGVDSTFSVANDFEIAQSGTGVFEVIAGATATSGRVYLGQSSNSIGTALISGPESSWTITGDLSIGHFSTARGTLNIESGGLVEVGGQLLVNRNNTNSSIRLDGGTLKVAHLNPIDATAVFGIGTVLTDHWLISGTHTVATAGDLPLQTTFAESTGQSLALGLTWASAPDNLLVFGVDDGEVTLEAGFAVTSANGYVGFFGPSAGVMRIDGVGTVWENTQNLYVGHSGTGRLEVSDGGRVTAGAAWVGAGDHGISEVILTGAGARWESNQLWISLDSAASFVVRDGATAATGSTTLGDRVLREGTIRVESPGSQLTAMDLTVGTNGLGRVELSDSGVLFAQSVVVARESPGVGALEVTGLDTQLTVSETLTVGVAGQGELDIMSGGLVQAGDLMLAESQAGFGSLMADGPQTRLEVGNTLTIGGLGQGTLLVQSGAQSASVFTILGESVGGIGTLSIDGPGSRLDTAVLTVGRDGAGLLQLTGAGLLHITDPSALTVLGFGAGGTGDVVLQDASTRWESDADVFVGYEGTGSITAQAGAVFSTAGDAYLGFSTAGSRGSVLVSGLDSQWTAEGTVYVGFLGEGVFTISNGATANAGSARLGVVTGSEAEVHVTGTGTRWTLDDSLSAGQSGDALLRIGDGGVIEIGGGLTLGSQAELTLVLGPEVPVLLDVTGDTVLDGLFSIETASGFEAGLGDAITLISIDGIRSGLFSNATEGATLHQLAGLDFVLTYLAGDGNEVAVVAALTGDVDGDEAVGVADLDILLANWGDTVVPFNRAAGDLSGDGLVGQADLQIVTSHWGNNASNTGTVPEPASALSLLSLLWINRRRQTLL